MAVESFFRHVQGFGLMNTGSYAGFTSRRPPPPWTAVRNLPYSFIMTCGLEKLGLVDPTSLENDLSPLLWSWVGDNNPSQSTLPSM